MVSKFGTTFSLQKLLFGAKIAPYFYSACTYTIKMQSKCHSCYSEEERLGACTKGVKLFHLFGYK